ncbi:ABC transporter ATP-binding protein [Microbacterium lacticum]|uniref:ABC transporter ATP-binding protein n=1 Tax=Microbacterium lacticum TaxID=33885 RepID=UPI001F5A56A4|nr:ABC transporter ATP-binding protein [Microbacterium lacticum]
MTDVLLPSGAAVTSAAGARPMIVADNAHVNYRVYASGKRFNPRENMLRLSVLRGGRELHTIPALRGVSFTASEGETIGVIGHNGSGKSTLFRAMTGLIPTAEGTIWAAARPVLLGVNAALVPELSGENNIKLGLLAMGFTPDEAAAHVDEIADFAELNEFLYHPMRTYSSGMNARLRFAIASAKTHSILLIDEALSVGDRRFKAKSDQRIRELQQSAGLVMIVSHSVGSLRDTCERVLWIHKGELRADGPSADVIDEYVRWTKQPGSVAVGAASDTAPKTGAAPSNAPASPEAHPDASLSPLEKLIADAASEAKELITPAEGLRTAARRERYRQEASERLRRRVLIGVITGAAILVAAAAGAAVAVMGSLTRADDGSSTTRELASPPAISAFAAATPTVACAAPTGTAEAKLSWEADDAVWVALAAGAAEIDAIDRPLASGLPDKTDAYAVAFPCTEEARVYTLTVAGGEGSRVSSTVTLTRALPPEPTATPAPDEESGGGSNGFVDESDGTDGGGSTVTDPGTGGTDPGTGGGTDPGTGGETNPGTGGGTDPGTGGETDPGTGGGETDPGTGGGETGAPVEPDPPAESDGTTEG